MLPFKTMHLLSKVQEGALRVLAAPVSHKVGRNVQGVESAAELKLNSSSLALGS